MNLYLLDESEKSLVFFGNESYKYKESVAIVLTKSFCFFLIYKKKVNIIVYSKSVNANVLHSALFGKTYKEQVYIDQTNPQNQRFVEEEKPIVIEKELQVLAFPNPANNAITFKLVNAEPKSNCTISLFDIRGKILLNFNLHESEGKKTISLESFSSGVYFYKVEDNEKVLQTNKLIIIK